MYLRLGTCTVTRGSGCDAKAMGLCEESDAGIWILTRLFDRLCGIVSVKVVKVEDVSFEAIER